MRNISQVLLLSFERTTPDEYFASKGETDSTVSSFIYGARPQQTFQLDMNVMVISLTALVLGFLAFLVFMKGGKSV